jgi:hypothetical protein
MFDNFFGPGGESHGHAIPSPNGTTDFYDNANDYIGQMNPNGAYAPGGEYLGNSQYSIFDRRER